MKKQQNDKILARKQDEETTNRILIVFSFILLILLMVMFVDRYMSSAAPNQNALVFCVVMSAVFAAVGVGVIITATIKRAKNTESPAFGRLITLSGVSLAAALAMLSIRVFTYSSFTALYVALPVTAFLYMIYQIYQREFFYQTIITGCAAGTLYAFSRWLHYKPWQPIVHTTYCLAIALLCAAIILTLLLKKRNGSLFGINLLPRNANYSLMFATIGLMLAAIAAVLLVTGIAFWMMIGVFGYLFVLAVYYTIKLI
ncbi:MAG: hypothetical protein FWG36_08295 [Oscillospiraceae bacterium]|nr:hypothetical protein [Oscillospiraceae bacterium]